MIPLYQTKYSKYAITWLEVALLQWTIDSTRCSSRNTEWQDNGSIKICSGNNGIHSKLATTCNRVNLSL